MKGSDVDATEQLLVEKNFGGSVPNFGSRQKKEAFFLRVALYVLAVVSVGYGLLSIGFALGRRYQSHLFSENCPGCGLIWSQSIQIIGRKERRFDGSLYSVNKYRGPPSEGIDREWDRFTTSPWMSETAVVLNVSLQDAQTSRNDRFLDTAVKLGGTEGGEGFMGTLEVFHQLHCLNLLRKWTYRDHYEKIDPWWTSGNNHRRDHTDHCIDILRQALMCNSDTGLILFHWVKGIALPSPDFHTMHQCRDPEEVLRWAEERAPLISHEIRRKGGELELPGTL